MSSFCAPEQFYGPRGLTNYTWLDENRTLFGFGHVDAEWNDRTRTLFWNFLDTDLKISLPDDNLPPFITLVDDETVRVDQERSWHLVPRAPLPLEVEADFFYIEPGTTSEFVFSPKIEAIDSNGTVLCQLPSANLTLILVSLEPNYNHVESLIAVGWTFISVIWFTCLLCLAWMYTHRRIRAVKVMQPLFLMAITIGVATLGTTILTLSLTDENVSLTTADRACQTTPWLMVMGFTIVFSALFCKLWRINKIFNGARQFRKLRVTEKDVLGPFLCWFAVNSIILALRTGLGLDYFERVEIDDNPANTVGVCLFEHSPLSWTLYTSNVAVTLSAFFAAAYQAYRARGVSEEYSESRPLMVALFIWTEILVICVPVLFLLQADSVTTTYFVVMSTIFGLCMSMLGALFVPLWRQVRVQSRANNTSGFNSSAGDARSVTSHVHVTGVQETVPTGATGRGNTSDHDGVDDLRMSVALGATMSQKEHASSELSHTETRLLLQKVADLEAQITAATSQIEQLQQRNQELESLCYKEGNGDNGIDKENSM